MKSFVLALFVVVTLSSCEMPFASWFQSEPNDEKTAGFVVPQNEEEKQAFIDNLANEHGAQTPEEKAQAETAEKTAWEAFKQEQNQKKENGEVTLTIVSPEKKEKLLTGDRRVLLKGEIGNAHNVATVEVNGFQLRKYKAGDAVFTYIADEKMKTLKRGDNTYKIQAKSANGEVVAETQFVIISDQRFSALAHTGAETWIFSLLFAGAFAAYFRRKSFL